MIDGTSAPVTGSAPVSGGEGTGSIGAVSAPASGQPASGASAVGAAPAAEQFTITVDGKPMQVTKEDLIARAQKGTAAEKRFEEASRMRKEAETHIQAVNELKEIIGKKDYNRAKDIFGEEFLTGLIPKGQPGGAPQYSEEDTRTAEALGVDVHTYVEAKMKAQGFDNPMVAKQTEKIAQLERQLSQVGQYMQSVKIENDARVIENQFRSVAEKFPDVDPNRVLDIVEREGRSAKDFESIFKTLDGMEKQRMEEKFTKYAEEKKKNSMSNFGGVNSSGVDNSQSREMFKGKTLNERKDMLKKLMNE